MHKIESREISNRKYLSKTILPFTAIQNSIGKIAASVLLKLFEQWK